MTGQMSSEVPEVVASNRRRLEQALKLVRDIGGDYLGGVIYSKLGRYTSPATERGRANSVESIAWLAGWLAGWLTWPLRPELRSD